MDNNVVEENGTIENASGIECPKCGSHNVLPISQVKGKTKGFGLGKAAVGGLALGPAGLAAGVIGMGKGKTTSEIVWVCKNCGNQFSAKKAIVSAKNKKNNEELKGFIKKHPIITLIIIVVVIIFAVIPKKKEVDKTETISTNETQDISVSTEPKATADISLGYKMVNERSGKSGFVYHKIEIYFAEDRDYRKMLDFAKSRGNTVGNSETMYRAVFFDDESFAILPEGQIQSEYWDNDNLKHMIAKYTKNFVNDFEEFSYWENNAYESVAKQLK